MRDINWLNELDVAAQRAALDYTNAEFLAWHKDGCTPERIRALIACVKILAESQEYIGRDWRARRDATLIRLEETP